MGAGEGRDPRPPRGHASRPSPDQKSATRRYSIYVGLAFVALIVVAAVNSVTSQEGSILGAEPDERGMPLPPFAVPEALGELMGDANVYQDDCETSRNPCPPADRRTPACEVEGEDVIRVCDYFDRPLVLSFWFTRGGDCLPAQDAIDEAAERYRGRVNFLSVNVRDDRDRIRQIIRERDWQLPVGHDADGAVANVYRVGVCPTVAFAYPGGILAGSAAGDASLTSQALGDKLDELLADSRRRAAADR